MDLPIKMGRIGRVRRATPDAMNRRLDRQAANRIEEAATAPRNELSERIEALRSEWDIERALQLNAGSLALIGTVLAATQSRRQRHAAGSCTGKTKGRFEGPCDAGSG